MARYRASNDESESYAPTGMGPTVGKRSLTQQLAARPGGGEPLPTAVRDRFERTLGADLGAVRVHDGAAAATTAAAAGARAVTVGNDIHFGAGQYQPDDPFGLHLLAHEVVHTQQQATGGARVQCKRADGADASDPDELAADAAADEMAPVSMRDPTAIEQAPIHALRARLDREREDNVAISHAMGPAIEAIDEELKTATGARADELRATRKDLAAKQKAADAKVTQAAIDLKVLERGPDVTQAQVNDVLARREVTAKTTATGPETTPTTTVDAEKASATRATKTTANEVTDDGASRTTTRTDATTVDATGVTGSTSQSTTTVKGATTTTTGTSSSASVDWSKGAVSVKSGDSSKTTTGDKTSGTSSTESLTIDGSGVSAGGSTTTEVDGTKTTTGKTTSYTRGDGELGKSSTTSWGKEQEDGTTSKASVTTSAGVIDGKDGIGVKAGVDTSASHRTASGLEVSNKAAADGRATINIRKIEDATPEAYEVAITITLSASGSLTAGGGSAADATNGARGSVGVSGGVTAVASYGYTLSAEQTKAWLAAVETGSGTGPEMQLIATGRAQGWGAARDLWESWGGASGRSTASLKDGESSSLDVTTTGGVNASAGGNLGPGSVGVEAGIATSHEVRAYTRRVGDRTITSFLIKDGDSMSAGGSAGYGVASYGVSYTQGSSTGAGYKFTVLDATAGADGLRGQLDAIRTKAALEQFAADHPELIGERTTTSGEQASTTNKLGVGPAEVAITDARSFDAAHTDELDANGKVVATTDTFSGSSSIGGKAKLGPVSAGSNHQEKVDAKVRTEIGPDGKSRQVASGDAQQIDTSSTTDLKGSAISAAENLVDDPLAVVTGKKPLVKQDEKRAVAGVLLSDADFDHIIALAESPDAATWNRPVDRPAHLDDWAACRAAIRAAKGDKVKVAEALARFGGGGEHGRAEVIANLIGANQVGGGGKRYAFPDGLGHLQAQFDAAVSNDPMPALAAQAATDPAGAAAAATALADKCDSIINQINLNADKFQQHDQRNDMLARLGGQATALRKRALEFKAQATGGPVNPALLDKQLAVTEWNQQYEYCKQCAADEQKYFDEISASDDVVVQTNAHNQLANLHKRWKPAYAKLAELHAAYPDMGYPGWKTLQPATLRLEMCDPGRWSRGQKVVDPNSEEARAAQDDQDSKNRQAEGMNRDILDRVTENATLTAGMTRTSSGSYYREATDAEKAATYVEVKGRITEQFPTWEKTIAGVRAEATAAKGKCNKLTSGGSWDPVVPAARRVYSAGFQKWAEAEQAWAAAQAAAKATGKGVLQFFPQVQAAKSAYVECAEQFRAGDGLQG